jgi:Predicted spermidine synthase with an N-terminal membrane domain
MAVVMPPPEKEVPPAERGRGADGGAHATVDDAPLTGQDRAEALTLLATVFIVAACGLIYELLIATISSYLLGSSVTQFSLCIGAFIGAMGLGSYVSQYATRGLLRLFIGTEILLAVVGGGSAWALFAAYTYLGKFYYGVLFGALVLIGGLVGLELPLLTRLLGRYGALRTVIAQALSFDYVGALLGSISFPLLLLPTLGTTRTAFVVGLLNLGVAAYNVWVFRHRMRSAVGPLALCAGLGALLAVGLASSERVSSLMERRLYEDEIIYAQQTPYQRIVITRFRDDLRLYLDGNLQFSAADEYRYHEALIHPAMALSASHEEVLLLGGGDGLAVREILKHPGVKRVTVVDIDPAMTDLAKTYPALVEQNANALADPRVRLVHQDAFTFLEKGSERFGVILADLPDPNNEALAKLYSREFYGLVRRRLGVGGVFVTQAAAPLFAREAFWCIRKTVEAAGFATTPYHVYVPSFGDWGFVMGRATSSGRAPAESALSLTPVPAKLAERGITTRYLGAASPAALVAFDSDNGPTPVEVSTLDFPRVLRYYETGAKKWE